MVMRSRVFPLVVSGVALVGFAGVAGACLWSYGDAYDGLVHANDSLVSAVSTVNDASWASDGTRALAGNMVTDLPGGIIAVNELHGERDARLSDAARLMASLDGDSDAVRDEYMDALSNAREAYDGYRGRVVEASIVESLGAAIDEQVGFEGDGTSPASWVEQTERLNGLVREAGESHDAWVEREHERKAREDAERERAERERQGSVTVSNGSGVGEAYGGATSDGYPYTAADNASGGQSYQNGSQAQASPQSAPSGGGTGYTVSGTCTDAASCQQVVDTNPYNTLSQYNSPNGSTYYQIHNNNGGSSMYNQSSTVINGQTHRLGEWQQAQYINGVPYGPDDGGKYVQTCGPDGTVYYAPVK